jgi:hypothetical protein
MLTKLVGYYWGFTRETTERLSMYTQVCGTVPKQTCVAQPVTHWIDWSFGLLTFLRGFTYLHSAFATKREKQAVFVQVVLAWLVQ